MLPAQGALNRIVITGMGLVTSLGVDAPSTLAAIRSGLANYSEHETVLVNADRYGTELRGATIARMPEQIISRHLHGADRALALLAPAIKECTPQVPQSLLKQSIWCITSGIEPIDANLPDLLQVAGLNVAVPNCEVSPFVAPALGRCQLFDIISTAAAVLRRGTVPIVFLGCVDSLCDNDRLQQLCDAERLKAGTNAEGIVAGEAAAVFMLELESQALARGADILAFLTSFGGSVEPCPWYAGKPGFNARGLREAFQSAFSHLPENGAEIDLVISDLNGEGIRGKEWGFTAPRIFPRDDKLRDLMHPVDCTGDCGIATAAILLATAMDLTSPPSLLQNVAICTSDEDTARRVICLQQGNGRPDRTVGCEDQTGTVSAIPTVVDQHFDEASFLWLLRKSRENGWEWSFNDLRRHDERIKANLDGLVHAGESGWEPCTDSLAHGDAGEYFTAAYLAYTSYDKDRVEYLLEKTGTDINLHNAFVSALGWLPPEEAAPLITALLSGGSPTHRYIGIAACGIHRHDPGQPLQTACFDYSPLVKARAVRAYGELGKTTKVDLGLLQSKLTDEDEAVRFWAAWSATLAGDREALEELQKFVRPDSPFTQCAIQAAFRHRELKATLSWHSDLVSHPDMARASIISAGVIGDPVLVPWVLEQMSTPAIARVAGEAFTMITGIDIAVGRMAAPAPEGYNVGPNEDPADEKVSVDPDESLPWPNVKLIMECWSECRHRYRQGQRHLLGKPITEDNLYDIVKSGRQRARAAAAMELTAMKPGQPLIEVHGPAFRQRRWGCADV